jgi:uncharacterized protein
MFEDGENFQLSSAAKYDSFPSRETCGPHDFLAWAPRTIVIDDETIPDIPRINQLLRKYSDLPADYADAPLAAMAERRNIQKMADSDFTIYRALGKEPFENVFWAQG